MTRLGKRELREKAQEELMAKIGDALGYWTEGTTGRQVPSAQHDEFRVELKKQADRVAKLLGYQEAWSN